MMHDARPKILIVDDDPPVLLALVDAFSEAYEVITATSGTEAVEQARQHDDLCTIVLDIKMADMDGIAAMRAIRDLIPDVPQILHTAYPGEYPESEIDENERPFDYVQKGGSLPRLTRSVRNAVETRKLKRDKHALISLAESEYHMLGISKAMQEVFRKIHDIAPTDSKVILLGESGTGKNMVAKAIHYASLRRSKPFRLFACNVGNKELVQAELFGVAKGGFTGAISRPGVFEVADGGTVFLDEVGELPHEVQVKLLQVIDDGSFSRIGSTDVQHCDVRILCATSQDLDAMVASGKFRSELYHRLNGARIELPSLRDRREDIPYLIKKFVEQVCDDKQLPPKIFDDEAVKLMVAHDWSGNVRWLQNTVEHLLTANPSSIIFAEDVAAQIGVERGPKKTCASSGLYVQMAEFERSLIIRALMETSTVTAAAKLLEIDRATLYKKMKSHGIDADSLRRP